MAEATGFAILDGTIEPHLIQQAANDIDTGRIKIIRLLRKHHQFENRPICSSIRDDFMPVGFNSYPRLEVDADTAYQNFDYRILKDLLGYYQEQELPQPDVTRFGQFLWTPGQPPNSFMVLNDYAESVYITIAITPLSPANGWYIFLKGSHLHGCPSARARCGPVPTDLEPGQAIAWHGNLAFKCTAGGDGSFINLVFRVPSFQDIPWYRALMAKNGDL
ncbi:MAG: hypothetical protein LQ337_006260 [Flavoplaca oasis]|nr:MAG: hypothetical protein LQ337_006260 [Flavoplaca oasis]